MWSINFKTRRFKCFLKGSLARVFRSSPQFGFTLASYELLQNLFPLHPPLTRESSFKGISGYPGVYNLTNDQVYNSQEKNERLILMNKSELSPSPSTTLSTTSSSSSLDTVNDTLVKLPAEYIYKSQDAVKLLLDIDYKFGNFNYDSYVNYIKRNRNRYIYIYNKGKERIREKREILLLTYLLPPSLSPKNQY